MATSPCRGLTPRMTVRPKQTTKKQRTIVHFSCQEREKKKTQTIDYQRQLGVIIFGSVRFLPLKNNQTGRQKKEK